MENIFDNPFFDAVLPFVREGLRWFIWLPLLLILFRWARLLRAQKDAAKPFALLTAQKGNERFEITGYETSIGRAKNSDIRLDYAFISRNHAVIAYRSKEWRLYDTDSSGGVTVNGKKVKDYAILQNGDSIGFADYEFLFSPSPDKTDSLDIYSYKDPTKRGKKRNKHDKKR